MPSFISHWGNVHGTTAVQVMQIEELKNTILFFNQELIDFCLSSLHLRNTLSLLQGTEWGHQTRGTEETQRPSASQVFFFPAESQRNLFPSACY